MTYTGLIERLREHLKLSYIGNCKCGECQLVPAPLIEEAATALLSLQGELATVRGAAFEEAAKIGYAELRDGNMMLDNEPPLFVRGYEQACNDYSEKLRARAALKGAAHG